MFIDVCLLGLHEAAIFPQQFSPAFWWFQHTIMVFTRRFGGRGVYVGMCFSTGKDAKEEKALRPAIVSEVNERRSLLNACT